MKRLLIILALLVLVCFNQLTAQTTGNKIPAYPNPNGVSAPFAGFIGDWLFTEDAIFRTFRLHKVGQKFITPKVMHSIPPKQMHSG